MLLSEAIEAFLRHLQFRRGSTLTTLVTYKSILGQFLEVTGNILIEELTLVTVDRFAEIYSLRGFKPKTFRNKLCVIKSFVSYLYAKELTNIRPESIEIPKDRPTVTEYLTVEEKDDLLKAARNNIRDYAMLLVLLSSGLRVSELCNLLVTDIYRGTVSVKNGKGLKHRVTFISKEAQQAISAHIQHSHIHAGYLFPSPSGTPLTRMAVGKRIKLYASRAGIQKNVKVHTLRHTFATHFLDSGGRIEDLQQMLGHSDMKTTMLYLHFTNERLHRAYEEVMS